ncbi:MAG: zinc-ribbon domain-containing protein [Candidatus Thorarchaeota archaeon]
MIIWGSKGKTKVAGRGTFFCPTCNSLQPYKHHKAGKYFTLYFVPVFKTKNLGEYVECQACYMTFKPEVLDYGRGMNVGVGGNPMSPEANEFLQIVRGELESGRSMQYVFIDLKEGGLSEREAGLLLMEVTKGRMSKCTECQAIFIGSIHTCPACNRRTINHSRTFKQCVFSAGPLLAILSIGAHFHELESPPAPSPVSAQLVEMKFTTWRDIRTYINGLRSFYIDIIGRRQVKSWYKEITQLSKQEEQLLSLTIPLAAENLMNSMTNYPSPAQDVFLNLLSPILDSDAPISEALESKSSLQKPVNANIYVYLYGGGLPFTNTYYGKAATENWHDHLEAAMTVLMPQIIFEAEKHLKDPNARFMKSALKEEVSSWKANLPTVGDLRDWTWLPRLL